MSPASSSSWLAAQAATKIKQKINHTFVKRCVGLVEQLKLNFSLNVHVCWADDDVEVEGPMRWTEHWAAADNRRLRPGIVGRPKQAAGVWALNLTSGSEVKVNCRTDPGKSAKTLTQRGTAQTLGSCSSTQLKKGCKVLYIIPEEKYRTVILKKE